MIHVACSKQLVDGPPSWSWIVPISPLPHRQLEPPPGNDIQIHCGTIWIIPAHLQSLDWFKGKSTGNHRFSH